MCSYEASVVVVVFYQTSYSSTNLLYAMAKNPELQNRLLDEFSKVLGDKAYPSLEDIQNMPLLRNCVKEVMRLYTAVPMNPRVLEEDAIIDGYCVPSKVSPSDFFFVFMWLFALN